MIEEIKSLTEVIVGSAERLVHGDSIIAPPLMVANRLAICNACKLHDDTIFCRSCGCIVEAKVRLSASHCPEGKWRSI